MKKVVNKNRNSKRLLLNTETIKNLTEPLLKQVAAAAEPSDAGGQCGSNIDTVC